MTAKPSLEGIITRFRREISGLSLNDTPPELEIRFQDVNYNVFASVYKKLLEKTTGELTQMVSTIMTPQKNDAHNKLPLPNKIREIYFKNGEKIKDVYTYKEPLMIGFKVHNLNLSYVVKLSSEGINDKGFTIDESALVRIKSRVSFKIPIKSSSDDAQEFIWRVDMTVVQQLTGGNINSSLKQIVDKSFRTKPYVTVENFLSALRCDDPAMQLLYKFEIEVELMSPINDSIRPNDVTAAAEYVILLANPSYLNDIKLLNEINFVTPFIIPKHIQYKPTTLKQLLPQAISLTRADYREIFPPKRYFVTDKADGKRALALIHDGLSYILTDTLHECKPKGELLNNVTIVDGEYVNDKFYGFDVILVNSEDVTNEGFEVRMSKLEDAVKILNDAGIAASAKNYQFISGTSSADLEKVIKDSYNAKKPYEIDGLILVEPDKSYTETTSYKWKPANHNTIDFLVRRAPKTILGKAPYIDKHENKLYLLFVGISGSMYKRLGMRMCPGYGELFKNTPSDDYFPIQFSPSDTPLAYIYYHIGDEDLDGKIIELRCPGKCAAAGGGERLINWELVKIREDRIRELNTKNYYGNNFQSAELIWLNYIDPFPIEQLWEGPLSDYFMNPKSGAYAAQTAVISFVKSKLINSLKYSNCVVDLGSGKGQDIARYINAEVKNLIAIDQDRAALSELIRRKYDIAKKSNSYDAQKRINTSIHILVTDLNDDYKVNYEKISLFEMKQVDAVVCNLAVHYLLNSTESMRNFIMLVNSLVKQGGMIILTALFGEMVHNLFKKEKIAEGESWNIFENDVKKYSIKRLYSSDSLETAGQKIGVLLPFSGGNYYEENLMNTAALILEFKAYGFQLQSKKSISESINEFKARNQALGNALTAGDKTYLSLYGELIFIKE